MIRRASLSKATLRSIRSTAVEASHAAGAILLRHFGRKLRVREKQGAGIVTQVDLAAEKAAMKVLLRDFPDFGVLTEESGQMKKPGPGRWVIDPLDGTTNYVHGFPMFCVSIAAEWAGEIVAGVIYHPVLNDTYVAVRGQGSTLNGKRIHVSRTKKLEDSLLTTGFTYRKERWLHTEMSAFERLSTIARAIRRPGSAALDLAYTARGVFDGFWERGLSPWDVGAGTLLVTEAGGKVTDFKGNPFSLEKKELLATNPALYRTLRQTIEPDYCPL